MQSKKLEKKKEAHGESANLDRSKKRKLEADEEKLKNTNKDLTMVKMKSMFAIGFAFSAPCPSGTTSRKRLALPLRDQPASRLALCGTQTPTNTSGTEMENHDLAGKVK